MRYRPQFQHKTGRMLGFTIATDGDKSGGGPGGEKSAIFMGHAHG
jgi:hypothetical protein